MANNRRCLRIDDEMALVVGILLQAERGLPADKLNGVMSMVWSA